jgi:hypothetical protein
MTAIPGQIETIYDYYLSQFPEGVRESRLDTDGLAKKLDIARCEALQIVEDNVRQMGKQFTIYTADIALDDYEEFLQLPRDDSLTTNERRQRILIKIQGISPTLTNIKTIAKNITGIDVEYHEYGNPLDSKYDPTNHPWKIQIIVDYNLPDIKTFNQDFFEQTMRQIHPEHIEWDTDSFIYIVPESFLAPADPGKKEFVLNEDFLQLT